MTEDITHDGIRISWSRWYELLSRENHHGVLARELGHQRCRNAELRRRMEGMAASLKEVNDTEIGKLIGCANQVVAIYYEMPTEPDALSECVEALAKAVEAVSGPEREAR